MNSGWMKAALGAALLSAGLMACDNGTKKAEPVKPDQKSAADAGQSADKKAENPTKTDGDKTAEAPKSTGPVARVNGVEISRQRYNEEIDGLKKRFAMFGGNIPPAQLAKFQQRILDRMVEDELIDQKLKAEKVTVDAAAIDAELTKYKERTPGGPEKFEEFLKKSGKTIDDLKKDVEKRLALRTFLNKDKALEVTEEEAKTYYEENKKRFTTQERVKAAHILIKIGKDDDDAKKAEAKKQIDAIFKEASKKGTDFAALAKAKSQGPSAPRGGDLGWFTRGRMVKEFEETAFKMKAGDVSKPVQTKFGWHVLKVYEREEAGEKKFEDVKEDIQKRMEARKFREAREKFIKSLKDGGKVEVLEKIVIPASAPASRPGPGMIKTPPGIKKIDIKKPGTPGKAAPKPGAIKVTPKKVVPAKKGAAPKPKSAPTSK